MDCQKEEEEAFAFVASSTWTGRVTCLSLSTQTMVKLWHIDCWTPIYSKLLVYPKCMNSGDNTIKKYSTKLIFGAIDGSVRCLDTSENGVEMWNTTVPKQKPIFSGCCPMKVNGLDCIVVGTNGGNVSCIDTKCGELLWSFDAKSAILGTPAVLVDDEGNYSNEKKNNAIVVVTTTSGFVSLIDSSTGEEVASTAAKGYRLDGEIFSSPILDSTNRVAYVGCRDNHLYKIRISKRHE
eukprot:5310635-Ditylum_brightwellii.AAC.1